MCVLDDICQQKKYKVSSFWCSNPVQLSSWPFPLSTFEGESRLMAGLFVLSLWQAWEGRAYEYGLKNLRLMGYPVHGLSFDNDLVGSHSLIPNQFHRTSPNV
jgi:hypothetical protein